jgi:23S rRNA (adenine2030-N6)-methyltransferase
MLSYRHAFHAGNHADILKHFVLMQVIAYMTQKDKPLWYLDTHAGAGMYALKHGFAAQNEEFETGIAKLWQQSDLPPDLANFVNFVKALNKPSNPKNAELSLYPGSPTCANALMRAQDKIRLFELHPSDFALLKKHFSEHRNVMCELRDGFTGLKAMLPPASRRAVALIDPPYEIKQDYQKVVKLIEESLQRFATGTYIVWYPLLPRPEPLLMAKQLRQLEMESWLDVRLQIRDDASNAFGMFGSGLFIVNPPWTLPKVLQEVMPYLVDKLGEDDGAHFTLEHHIP